MYFKFRKSKQEKQTGEPKSGVLKIEVPHWSAQVRVFNGALQPESEIGKIKSDRQLKSGYSLEAVLPPGNYLVQTSLEGKTESEWIPVNAGKMTEVSPKAWANLKFTSASPLEKTDNFNRTHTDEAEKLSREITWKYKNYDCDSRLFLFVRTLDPKNYGGAFSDGLQLLTERGELVTDFSDGIRKNKRRGWMAFNADLPAGGYILRRGRRGVHLRYQVFYLCGGWETQIFLKARAYPSLSTWSVNMAPHGVGFHPFDEAVLAAEVITDNLRHSSNSSFLLQNEKIRQGIDVLLDEKMENPWLGILAAHAIERLTEQTREDNPEVREYFDILEQKVKPFLHRALGEHPDVRALLLNDGFPAEKPFDFPPSLLAGLQRAQTHSVRFADTIPLDSLTDCAVDSLVINAPWTAWRHLVREPKHNLYPQSKRLRVKQSDSTTDFSVSAVLSQTAAPRTPVYRLAEDEPTEEATAAGAAAVRQTATETVLQDAPMIQKVKERVLNYAKNFDLGSLRDKIEFNSSEVINNVLSQVTSEEISLKFGISLSRTEESLKVLHSQVAVAGNAESDEPMSAAQTMHTEKSLLTVEQAILEYALNKFGKTESEAAGEGAAQAVPKYTIREIVSKIQSEADRLCVAAAQNPDFAADIAQTFAGKLYRVAENLLKHADFVLITDQRGKILYSNGTFLLLILPKSSDRALLSESETNEARSRKQKNWENVLESAQTGLSEIINQYEAIEWRKWRLSRTEIDDRAANRSISYLNLLRVTDFPPLGEEVLREIDAAAANLTFYAPLLVYGSKDNSEQNGKNLIGAIERLEARIKKTNLGEKKMEGNRQTVETEESAEMEETITIEADEEKDAVEPTLYSKEFFNIERHNLITGTSVRLFSANTAARVQEIFAPFNEIFDDQGGWADEIKKNAASRPQDEETGKFFNDDRNKSHKKWHYVNLPLGAESYNEAAGLGFTRENDVVQMINECVRVLQGESDRFSEINALRLLGHLVGDVHQPLHVGCGFIDDRADPPKFVTDPQLIRQHNFDSDTGGNAIALPGAGKMHSYWDAGLDGLIDNIELDEPERGGGEDGVERDADFAADENLKAELIEKLYQIARRDFAGLRAGGGEADDETPITDWAEQWANDSLVVAREAYRTLRIVQPTASGYKVFWEGKTAYNERCAPLLRNQMALAARHLAEMLNAIYD